MNPDTFGEWYRRQGRTVHKTERSYWHEQGHHAYQAFPYHLEIQPSEEELAYLIKEAGAIALRYSTPISQPIGKVSYHVFFDKEEMLIKNLHKKVRHDVCNGLNFSKIEPISFQRLADEGWGLRADTLQRQGRRGAENLKWWRKLCLSADGLTGFEAWAAIHDGELASAVITFTSGDTCSILFQLSCTRFLKNGVNNALSFVVVNEAFQSSGVRKIFYGLHSLEAPASVDNFKFRMGFVAHPVRQRIVLHPLAKQLLNPQSHRLICELKRVNSMKPFLAKVEGVIRFYLQGLLPLELQEWPENLLDQKQEILNRLFPLAAHKSN
jgi:hypothetical protein